MSLTTLLEGRYLDVNDSFLRMSGYSREEVIGRTSTELNIWDKPGTRHELVKRVAERGYLRNTETRFRRKDGTFRVLFSSIETLNINGEPCLLFASSDITERKLAEDRFRRFFDLPLVGMAITSPTRRFLVVNQKLCQLLGYSAEELTQMSWAEVTHPEDVAENIRLLEETLQGETEGYVMDKRFIHRDGRVIYASLSAQCVRDEDGRVDQLVLIVQDITERKQAEQWLSELTGRLLRYQDEERRRIARELHDGTAQGIGVILLNLARVKRAAVSLDSASQDRLTESIALGEEALKDIRTLSYVLHPPLLDQAGLATALHWYVKGFSERSGVKIDFVEVGDDGNRMPPDVEYSLFRVVQECLTNIRRHTNSENAHISLTRTGEEVVLKVRDFGTPLKVETPKNGDGIESLGVGIPGMRHRLKQLGGDLVVETAADGTTVTATVPAKWVIYDSNFVG
jgi:PAS domain S-box-containing protein